MSGLGGFLQGVGVAMGQNIEWQKQDAIDQSTIALRQQAVQRGKLEMDTMQSQNILRQQIGKQIADQEAQDASTITNPLKDAQLWRSAESKFLATGDFEGASHAGKMADELTSQSKEATAEAAKKAQQNKETLSAAAADYASNPTADGASAVARAAVAAGEDPLSIPPPNTPAFQKWVEAKQTAAMTGAQRVEFVQRSKERQDALEQRKKEEQAREEDRRDARADRAAAREQMLQLRRAELADRKDAREERTSAGPKIIESGSSKYEFDPSNKVQGDRDLADKRWVKVGGIKTSVSQDNTTNAVVGAASEATRGLHLIGSMPPGQSAGAFAGINAGGGIMTSLEHVGSNLVTPQSMQMYQTASKGLGLELGRVLTLGGGRGVNQAQIHELQNMTQVAPGDTEYEAMFKYANAADIVRNRLSTLPDSSNPKVLKQQKETEALLAKIPTPEQVLAAASKDPKMVKKLSRLYANTQAAAKAITDNQVTDADITHTMEANHMTREQVISALKQKGYDIYE